MRIILLSCVLIWALAPAAAQGPPVEAGAQTLYVWSDGDAPFLSTDPEDPRTVDSIEPAEGGVAGAETTRGWVAPFPDGLAHPILLDPTGTVDFAARIGGGTGAGAFDLEFRLMSGDAVVAKASIDGVTYAGDYEVHEVSAAVELERLDPADALVWHIEATGTNVQFFLGTEGDSRLVLPVLRVLAPAAAPTLTYGNHTGPDLDLSIRAQNATNGIQILNWTTQTQRVAFQVDAALSNGSVQILVTDPAGLPVINRTLQDTISFEEVFDAPAGNWSLEFVQAGFVGEVNVTAGPVPQAADGNATAPPQTNATAGGNLTTDKESPLPLFLVLAALVAVARRR